MGQSEERLGAQVQFAERAARDAFVVPAALLSLSPSDGSKNLPASSKFPAHHSQFLSFKKRFISFVDDEPRGLRVISLLHVGPHGAVRWRWRGAEYA